MLPDAARPRLATRTLALAAAGALAACAREAERPSPSSPAPGAQSPASPDGTRASPGARFPIEPGGYTRAFDAARDALRDAGFALDRVDAQDGVITTRPRVSSGLATPWTGAEGSMGASASALFNVERRRVEVQFVRVAGGAPGAFAEGAVSARVLRSWSPGRRVDSSSIRLTSYATDPALTARGFEPDYTRDVGADDALAERLAEAIRERITTVGTPTGTP